MLQSISSYHLTLLPSRHNSHPPLAGSSKDIWDFIFYRSDGRVHIIGEWVSRTKAHRYIVIGPDWACVAMTYIVIITPSVFVAIYLLVNLAEKIIYFILFGLCIFGLTTVFTADPGLVRKYHHARSRHWTYWYTHTPSLPYFILFRFRGYSLLIVRCEKCSASVYSAFSLRYHLFCPTAVP